MDSKKRNSAQLYKKYRWVEGRREDIHTYTHTRFLFNMAIQRKQRNYRKKKPESDEEEVEQQNQEESTSGAEDIR